MTDFRWDAQSVPDAQAERTERSRLFDILRGHLRELQLRDPPLPVLRRLSDEMLAALRETQR